MCPQDVQFLLHLQQGVCSRAECLPPGRASAAGRSGRDCMHRNNESERGLTGLNGRPEVQLSRSQLLRDEFSLWRLDMTLMVSEHI